jgi:hypothetical protein
VLGHRHSPPVHHASRGSQWCWWCHPHLPQSLSSPLPSSLDRLHLWSTLRAVAHRCGGRCWVIHRCHGALGACFCQVLGIGVLLLFRRWYPPCWLVHTSFPPYEQFLIVEVSGAIPIPVPVPIPVIVVIVIPLTVPLAPFSTGSGLFLAWCLPMSSLAANTHDPPCKQFLADVGVGAGSSVIIGVCCGRSSLVAVSPRSEGLGGGGQ